MRKLIASLLALLLLTLVNAQVTLSGTTYTQNFDGLATGLPTGWSVRSAASSGAPGSIATFNAAPAQTINLWTNFNSGFKNYAAIDNGSFSQTADSTTQVNATDRALGIRQTGSLGDPGGAFVLQLANTTGFNSFSMKLKYMSLDNSSARVTIWLVDYATGAAPTTFTPVPGASFQTGGSAFRHDSLTINFGAVLNNINDIVWIRVVTLAASTGSGNRASSAIDDVQLNFAAGASDNLPPTATTLSPANGATNVAGNTIPVITFNEAVQKGTGNIIIKNITQNTQQSIDVTSANVTLTSGAFGASIGGINFVNQNNYQIEIPAGAFKDLANNNFAGLAGNNWAFSVGNIAALYSFDNCSLVGSGLLPNGWTQYSVVGDNQFWGCTTFGQTGNGVQVNGFQSTAPTGPVDNEDWLISPAYTTTVGIQNFFRFSTRSRFAGPKLQCLISTNYTPGSNPNAATWTPVIAGFPPVNSDVWYESPAVNFASTGTLGSSTTVYVAFKYVSSPTLNASRWTFDDFKFINQPGGNSSEALSSRFVTNPANLDFYTQTSGTSSATRSFDYTYVAPSWPTTAGPSTCTALNVLRAPAGFKIARSAAGPFQDTVRLNIARETSAEGTIYVQYQPTAANVANFGAIGFDASPATCLSGVPQIAFVTGNAYPAAQTLKVANWNVLWFGSTANGPTDDAAQATNVKRILDSIKADVYAFQEVVDTARFGTMIRGLADGPYSYVITDFSSGAANSTDANWPSAQKLAFAYKTSLFSNVRVRGLLRSSATANTNWASGRFPHLLEADVTVNGITKPMKFINMHGKAGATPSDYQNRRLGYKELKDTLDAQFSTANLILLGDYNDVFNGTICGTCPTTISSVQDIITDSTDADSYKSKFSLHLAQQGLASTVSNPGMIDNVVVSNELENSLIPYSVERYSNVLNIITSYGSANTSDHFPIISRYSFNTVTSVGNIVLSSEKLNAYPNPANGFAIITNLRKAKTSHIQVLDIMGKLVQQYQYRNTVQGQNFVLNTGSLAPGSYIVKLQNDNTVFVGRLIVQK